MKYIYILHIPSNRTIQYNILHAVLLSFCPALYQNCWYAQNSQLPPAAQNLREGARGSEKEKEKKQRLVSILNKSDIFIWHHLGQTSLGRNTVFPAAPTRHIAVEDPCEIRDAEGFTVTNQLTGALNKTTSQFRPLLHKST